VRKLQRTRIGPLTLGDLPQGAFRSLQAGDLQFVWDAERLYLANKEAWDAELPPEQKQRKRRRADVGKRGPRGGPRSGREASKGHSPFPQRRGRRTTGGGRPRGSGGGGRGRSGGGGRASGGGRRPDSRGR
jgi:hypothetical protein